MVSNYYCRDCDKFINRKFRQKHTKSKAHIHVYYNIVSNKFNIGNILWSDFENIIHEYIKENSTIFYAFSVLVKSKLVDKDLNNCADNPEGFVPLYKFDNSGWIYYKYCRSKKVRDYTFHRAMLKDIKLDSSSIISIVSITIFSKYKSMTAKHKMQQPRRILESKLLKHIHNVSCNDKINKYNFLSREYDLI